MYIFRRWWWGEVLFKLNGAKLSERGIEVPSGVVGVGRGGMQIIIAER